MARTREEQEHILALAFIEQGFSASGAKIKASAMIAEAEQRGRMEEQSRLEEVASHRKVKCTWCGSGWSDVHLFLEKERSPAFLSCCPERDPVPEKWLERMKSLAGNVIQEVSELSDRNSPDDNPDMMLVTHEELAAIINGNLGI